MASERYVLSAEQIRDLSDDEMAARLPDDVVAALQLNHGDGLAIGVPGAVWTDEYITVWLHEDGTRVVDDDIGTYTDMASVQIPLSRIDELRQAIDKACEILAERRRVNPPTS